MLKKLHLFILFLFSIHTLPLTAQYYMSNGTENTCSGNFYDSGGPSGNYGNNENYTLTFCSPTPGSCIRLLFTTFDIEPNADFLSIYDGSSTASPLIGTYTGNSIPGIIVSGSGCLTIRFTSNNTANAVGWQAIISCFSCNGGNCTVTCNGGSTLANDACSGAQNLGMLPLPASCPGGMGGLQITNGSNLCANAEIPYSSLLGCQPSGDMASPASDVWYRFNITGPTLNVSISGLNSPNVGLYEGTSCNNLIPRGCAIGHSGALSTSFTGLAPGMYFLQVSGGSLSDQCNYSMALQNNYDCAGCVIQSSLTATPPPVNGSYAAGQTVQFCYTITDFNQTSANWLHGIVPTFGPGWNLSTLVPTPPANCSGSGSWGWYSTNVTSSATGNVNGPGFYYESPWGNPFNINDGNPGNNFGDNNGTNSCDWSFCWTIQTDAAANCIDGISLNIGINTLGDGESGSWTSQACTQDPVTNFLATLSCCPAPIVNITNPSCGTQAFGSATVQGQGVAPYDYVWFNASGTIINTQNNLAGASSLLGLAPGNYMVQVTDNIGCTTNTSVNIVAATSFSVGLTTTDPSCFGGNDGGATVNITGGSPGFTYAWSPAGSGASPSNLAAGNYTVTVTDSRGCTATAAGLVSQPVQLSVNTLQQVNVSCNGGQDGSLNVSAAGGTGPYFFSWSTGAAGSNISGLSAGSYTVTVTDNNGCTESMMQLLSQPAVINLSLSSTNASCGNSNGSAAVVANGGSPGYGYSWSPSGGSSANATALPAGGYVVTVTDSRGCTALGNVVVSNSSGPTANISAFTDVTCAGGNNGSATATVNGGTTPLVYSWTPSGGNGISAFGLSAGNYTFKVTDASGCTSAASVIIGDPPQLSATITANIPASCSNENDGSLTVQANGGVPGYSYSWSGGPVSPTADNLTPGVYSVTVTDVNGCTSTASATVSSPSPLLLNLVTLFPAACNGLVNGSATVDATGGTSPYNYLWSSGAAGSTASSLASGIYTITVTDNSGCTEELQVVVTEPSLLSLALSTTGTTCGSSNGSASVVVNGGVTPYSYSWNPAGGTGSSAIGLSSGNYTVIVTDANGCTAAGNAAVPSANGPALVLNSRTDISCPGGSDGGFDVSLNGGVLPYTIQWSHGNQGLQQTGLSAGTYVITVSDANGCNSALSITLAEPSPFSFVPNATDANCGQADGSLDFTVSGGTPGYTWLWSNGSNAAGTLAGINAGTFTLTLTDSRGCSATASAQVDDTPGLLLSPDTVLDVSCPGGSDGRISVNIAGGQGPYSYLWSNGANVNPNINIPAGTYTVTVTDANGCTGTFSSPVNDLPGMQLNLNSTPATCGGSNGSASVSVSGGFPGYAYTWIPAGGSASGASGLAAGSYTVEVTDNKGCTMQAAVNVPSSDGPSVVVLNTNDVSCNGGSDGSAEINVLNGQGPFRYEWFPIGGNTAQATGLGPGNYTVEVTDTNGCIAGISLTIAEPPALQVPAIYTQATCGNDNGSAQVLVSGGTGAYQYLWSNGATTNIISSIASGSYTVTVTDANGCTSITNVAVPNAGGPNIAVNNVSPASCNGGANGSASVVVYSGNGPFLYNWLPSGGTASMAAGLSAGNYSVQVTDANGCISQQAIVVQEPAALALQSQASSSSCNAADGLASVNVSGGTTPYIYSWSNGSANDTAFALVTGNYDVTVTDANNCSATLLVNVPGLPGPSIDALQVVPVTCAGLSNGNVTTLCSSGTPPYAYSWSNGSSAAQLSAVPAGSYTITVTDAFGCSAVSTVQVTEPAPLQATGQALQMVRCFGRSDGIAEVTGNGGTAPYQALWSNGAQTLNTGNLAAGTYTLLLSDANGCTSTSSVTITEPNLLKVSSVQSQAVRCFGEQNGSINCQSTGGTLPYSFLWSTSDTTASVSGLAAGTYTLSVTDSNGCLADTSIQLSQPTPLAWTPVQAVNILCNGDSSGNLLTGANGSVAPYNFAWSTGGSGASLTGLTAGTYTVTVTDANGCTSQRSYILTEPPALELQAQAVMVSCNGQGNGSISAVLSGGVNPYQLNWGNGTTGNSLNNLNPGPYTLTITDANGCKKDTLFIITEPPVLTASVAEPDTLCIGQSTALQAQANGGTPPYSYVWNTGGITNSLLVSPALSTTYQVLITDTNGCTFTASDIAVNVFSPLSVRLSVTEDTLCFGEGTSFTVLAGGGNGGPYTYLWNTTHATGPYFSLRPDSTFLYTVILSDACTALEPSASQQVLVNPLPVVDFIPLNQNGCLPVTVNFASQSITTPGAAYLWDLGDGNKGYGTGILHTYIDPGTYDVTLAVTDTNGCFASLERPAMIEVFPLPTAFFSSTPDKVSILLPEVNFLNGSSGALSAQWNFGDGSPLENEWSPMHVYTDTGRYRVELIVVSNDGCRDTSYNEVIINGEITFYVPKAFTPNNDGNNDMFTGYGIGIRDVDFLIFDRWGNNIYRSNNLARGWDGTYYNSGDTCPEGTYVYLFRVSVNGEDLPREYTGRVTLVR